MTISAPAQEKVDAAVNAKIRDEGLNRSQVLKTFEHFTEAIGPRLTGWTGGEGGGRLFSRSMLKDWGYRATLTSTRGILAGVGIAKVVDRARRTSLHAADRLSRGVVGVDTGRDRRHAGFHRRQNACRVAGDERPA